MKITAMPQSFSFRLLLIGCAATALVACTEQTSAVMDMERRGGTPAEAGSAESLLAAEGDWNIVEEEAEMADPASLHSQAKKRVDPSSMKKKTFIPESKLALAQEGEAGEDINYRLLRVERNIESLQNDFKKLLPPLSNLIVADRNLDSTIDEIQTKNDIQPASGLAPVSAPRALTMDQKRTAMAAPGAALKSRPAPAPVPVAAAASAPASAPAPAAAGQRAVKSLRLGEHPGRTRIVLDVSGPAKFSSDVDNNEKLLLIELPGTAWSAEAQKKMNHPLIAGYTAQPGPDGGTMLALELKKGAKVTGGSALPPNSTYNNHRVFVDIAPL